MGKINPRKDFLGTKTPGEFLMRGAPDRDDQKYWHAGDNFDRFKDDAYQADMNRHLASAAGGFSMQDKEGGKNAKNWGKTGKEYTHHYVTELQNRGYSTQSIFEAFKQTGGSAFNSLQDFENTLALLKGKYSSGDSIKKKLKDKEPKMELVENPYADEEEGLDPFVKDTKDFVNGVVDDNISGDLYGRVFPMGSRTGQFGTTVPSPGDEQTDSASQNFAAAMKAQIIQNMREGMFDGFV